MSEDAPTAFRPRFVTLPDKPTRAIAYTLSYLSLDPTGPRDAGIFIIFVNGLGVPQAWWQPTIEFLRRDLRAREAETEEDNDDDDDDDDDDDNDNDSDKDGRSGKQHTVSIITYDRDGQGLSQRPGDSPPQRHDILSSVNELHYMISLFRPHRRTKLFLVAHSLGVPISRLYCHLHPRTVSALLAVDSNIASTDFVSLLPDPDSPEFDAGRDLPEDTTVEQLRETRENYRKMFHPSAPNPENLDRTTVASLLPRADEPVLLSPPPPQLAVKSSSSNGNENGRNDETSGDSEDEKKKKKKKKTPRDQPILLTVIGHDPIRFAEENLKISTRGLTDRYMQPPWAEYNRQLLKLGRSIDRDGDGDGDGDGDEDGGGGGRDHNDAPASVVIASGAGHFVQKDNPRCIADEILKMLDALSLSPSSSSSS